jgi:hypothetical protein
MALSPSDEYQFTHTKVTRGRKKKRKIAYLNNVRLVERKWTDNLKAYNVSKIILLMHNTMKKLVDNPYT